MKVTIVIPLYNRESVILETLQSVSQQTINEFECLIIDDGSTDDSVAVVEQYISQDNRFRLIHRDRLPKGANTCRNIGLKQAKADYILFLDSDDILADNFLDSQLEYIIYKSCDAVISRIFEFDNDIKDNLKEREIGANLNLNAYIKNQCSWITSAVLWNKRSIEQINGFDEGIMKWQDWLLNIKALSNDYYLVKNSKTKLFYRVSLDVDRISSSKSVDKYHFDEFVKTRLLALKFVSKLDERRNVASHLSLENLNKVKSTLLKIETFIKVTYYTQSLNFIKAAIKWK